MLRLSFRRSSRTRFFRATALCLVIALLIDVFSLSAARHRVSSASNDIRKERIFIASIHWNNEAILRSHWNQAVLQLVEHFGPENVHVSILESGSWDDSKGALRLLDGELGKRETGRTIILDETTHADEIGGAPGNSGWIDTARGKKELRRIPYLSRLRNRSLEPLVELADKGIKFDKLLFLNDVVFDVCPCIVPNAFVNSLTTRLDSGHLDFARHKRRQLRCGLLSRFLETTALLRHFCATRLQRRRSSNIYLPVLPILGFPQCLDLGPARTGAKLLERHCCV